MPEIKDIRPGDHLCLPFTHESEQRAVLSAYVADGLERGERVVCITGGSTASLLAWLGGGGVDLTAAMVSGRLEVLPSSDTYLRSGRFDPDEMIAELRREVARTSRSGFKGLRMSGEMDWALTGASGTERLEEYERRLKGLYGEGGLVGICHYDRRLFPPHRLETLIACHLDTVRMNALCDGRLRVLPTFDPDGRRVLNVIGTIDLATAPAWTTALRHATDADAGGDLLIEMSEVEFIDVVGLYALVQAAARLPAGRRLSVANLAATAVRVCTLMGWHETVQLITKEAD
ncbi:MEDS domain-containing protein [Nonomuraea sp. NPDC050643]|uniref:MEDS domain-containing protein n=1 Tax=Nonomuraea sp. NPDC050643 TaxID=3155660 RepID=UPI0033EF5084